MTPMLRHSERALLAELGRRAKHRRKASRLPDGSVLIEVGTAELAQRVGYSRGTVAHARRRLVAAGLVVVWRLGHGPDVTVYRVPLP